MYEKNRNGDNGLSDNSFNDHLQRIGRTKFYIVLHTNLTEAIKSSMITSRAAGARARYPARLTAFRKRQDRQAYPPLIALGPSVAENS